MSQDPMNQQLSVHPSPVVQQHLSCQVVQNSLTFILLWSLRSCALIHPGEQAQVRTLSYETRTNSLPGTWD